MMQQHNIISHFSMDRIVPFFQPIIDLHSNKVWRYETLPRVIQDNEHLLLPSKFIYIVDERKANCELTRKIFSQSLSYVEKHPLSWNINLSSEDLNHQETLEWLAYEYNSHADCTFGLQISLQDTLANASAIKQLIEASPIK